MLTALFADIHGNREAFSACLAHAEHAKASRYVFLGDYVGYGADPGWVVDRVSAEVKRGAAAVMGNHDAAILSTRVRMNEIAQAAIEWTRGKLSDAQRGFLRDLPLTVTEGDRLFVHASAAEPGDWEYVLGLRDAARSLSATPCRETYCGHVHVPALYNLSTTGNLNALPPSDNVPHPLPPQRRWLAVLGAVGQPRDGNPFACYGLLDDERGTLTYVRVPYDVDTAARKIAAAGLPRALSERLKQGY